MRMINKMNKKINRLVIYYDDGSQEEITNQLSTVPVQTYPQVAYPNTIGMMDPTFTLNTMVTPMTKSGTVKIEKDEWDNWRPAKSM
jgi:hypothetical protein